MKFSKFLLISSFTILFTCTPPEKEDKVEQFDILDEIGKLDMQSDKTMDSILNFISQSSDLSGDQVLNIHVVLQQIINEKTHALAKLDSINAHVDSLVIKAKEYVSKKNSEELRKKLLIDIQKLKSELEEIKPRTIEEVIQKPIPNTLKSLVELASGNYRTRIDKTHILQFFVDEQGEIFVAPLIIDSTTVFTGAPLTPKVIEQIKKIRESLKNQN